GTYWSLRISGMSEAAKPAAPARPQSMYFVNGPVDYAVIGGLSLVAYAVCVFIYNRFDYDRNSEAIPFVNLATRLAYICNFPHFAATSYRLYHSRDNIRQYPLTALLIPWLVLAGVFGSLCSPTTLAPYFVMIFLIWSPYHFSGQTVGVSMIYARRAGFMV